VNDVSDLWFADLPGHDMWQASDITMRRRIATSSDKFGKAHGPVAGWCSTTTIRILRAASGDADVREKRQPIADTKFMNGSRLMVRFDYGAGDVSDEFEWELYTLEEIESFAANAGLWLLSSCSGFDEGTPASADVPRMQIVFGRP
jgi:hypothetical protein